MGEPPAIERHISRLRRHRGELAACIREAILRETPVYGALSGEEAVAWARGVDGALRMFLDSGIAGRALTDDEVIAMEAIGRARAEQDVPLAAIAASIAVAARVVRDWPLHHVDGPTADDRAAIAVLSERATTFANAITSAALHAYVARKEELATSLEQARVRLFDRVLSGRFDDEAAVVREAEVVGCDMTDAWVVVLVPTTAGLLWDRLEADVVKVLPGAVIVPMAATTAPHTAIVAPVGDEHALGRLVRMHETSVLRVGPCVGIERLQRSYRTARALVPYLDRLVPPPAVVVAAEHREAALLATVPDEVRDAYLADVLGGIEDEPRHRARRLLHTLEVLVHCDSLKAAAHALGVNVKTVRRHVEQVEQLSGLRLDTPDGMHRALVAVTLRRMKSSRTTTP